MNTIIKDFFLEISCTESSLYSPVLSGDTMCIQALNVHLFGEHPLRKEGYFRIPRCEFAFIGVGFSQRTIVEYIGDPGNPKGHKPKRTIIDISLGGSSSKEKYEFEGFLVDPPAWIDRWDVLADEFVLRLSLPLDDSCRVGK